MQLIAQFFPARRAVPAVLLAVTLAACSTASEKTPTPTPVASATARSMPTHSLPPTWTPSVPAPSFTPVRLTPAPSFTPRPTLTVTPGPTPGAVRQGEMVIVIVLQADLNAALVAAYAQQPPPSLAGPPVVELGYSGRVEVSLGFFNEFLMRDSRVTTLTLPRVESGVIVLDEVRSLRTAQGALVSDSAVRAALTLIEVTLTDLVAQTAQTQVEPDGLRLVEAWAYPGYVRAVYIVGGEG